ncbi:MAG: hypothetical protein M1826_001315 [Phylliscum demangeonii]|nr:MAG: hypothetical protein M1826_001315 [Phylliscum demangeonii]
MGSSSSKAAPPSSQHVFSSDAPIRLSQGMIDALQTSNETDSTRQKTLELHIQSRVADELQRIEERASHTLREVESRLAAESAPPAPASEAASHAATGTGTGTGTGTDSSDISSDISTPPARGRDDVQREIAALQSRLQRRAKPQPVDEQVQQAREGLVACLRTHEQRPLDCWKEAERFKREVARLEEAFVDRTLD